MQHSWIILTYFKQDSDGGYLPYHGGFFCTTEQAVEDYAVILRREPDVVDYRLCTIPYHVRITVPERVEVERDADIRFIA